MYKAEIDQKIDALNDLDQKQFWYLLKKDTKKSKHGRVLRNKDGIIISDVDSIGAMWEQHFSNLAQPNVKHDYDEEFKCEVERDISKFYDSLDEMSKNVMEDPITTEEVKSVCKNLKCGKAQDFTGLHYENFKYASDSVFQTLAELFNRIVKNEELPEMFRKGIIIALFKGGGKDPLDINNYRGITIQNVLCKIYESILSKRCSPLLNELVDIVPTQAACKKGRSSVHASLCVQEAIAHASDNDTNIYITYFDTKKHLILCGS